MKRTLSGSILDRKPPARRTPSQVTLVRPQAHVQAPYDASHGGIFDDADEGLHQAPHDASHGGIFVNDDKILHNIMFRHIPYNKK